MAKIRAVNSAEKGGKAANLSFERKLWLAADKLRNNMDAAEYKHVVLGLIFNVIRARQFYLAYPKGATLSHLLSWSHVV